MSPARVATSIVGPRIPDDQWRGGPWRYLLPSLMLTLAAGLLLVSMALPYWRMTLHAPQYPKGLQVQAHLNRLSGDVEELDRLNHYIGMRPLNEAAQIERRTAFIAVGTLSMLVLAAVFIHSRWAALLALPAAMFPVLFLLDLYLWMNHFGQNLDPKAALSSSIKPFTPPVLGEGLIGQFRTVAEPCSGLIVATVAAVIVIVALWFHRRAYKPLVDAQPPVVRRDDRLHREPQLKEGQSCHA
jgi:hypothetical protein